MRKYLVICVMDESRPEGDVEAFLFDATDAAHAVTQFVGDPTLPTSRVRALTVTIAPERFQNSC